MKQFRGRLISGEDKDTEVVSRLGLVLRHLASLVVAVADGTKDRISGDLIHLGVGEYGNLLVVSRLVCNGLGTGKVVLADEDGDVAGILGEEDGLLSGGKTSANDKDLLTGKELTVAGGTVGHAMTLEFGLALESNHAGTSSGGQKNAEALELSLGGMDALYIALHRNPLHFGQHEFGTEILCLLSHCFGQGSTAGMFHSGVVYHFVCDGNLPAKVVFLYNKNPVPGAGQIQGCCETSRTATDNNYIVDCIVAAAHNYRAPTRSRLGFSVSAPGCHLAGQTWSPFLATNWLACTLRSSSSALRPTLPAFTS